MDTLLRVDVHAGIDSPFIFGIEIYNGSAERGKVSGKFIFPLGVCHYPWLERPHLLREALRDLAGELKGSLQRQSRSNQIDQNEWNPRHSSTYCF
jgi:hypothetical protein